MFLVTTAPAPITALLQMEMGRIVALLPMDTLYPIVVLIQSDLSPCAGPPLEKRSLINITP